MLETTFNKHIGTLKPQQTWKAKIGKNTTHRFHWYYIYGGTVD